MDHEEFGTTDDYVKAFEAVRAEGIPNNLQYGKLAARVAQTPWSAHPAEQLRHPSLKTFCGRTRVRFLFLF
jgi:hypothetical protein